MIEKLLFIPVLIFSVIVHECAHGVAALRAGDPTAKMMGRITLNPIPHIDLIGSIVLPGILLLSGSSFLFGWAKPVPVNPNNFKNFREDEIRVSFAGPASNFFLSLVFLAVAIFYVLLFGLHQNDLIFTLLQSGILINLVLAVFNLLPIPPLDGSHILENILPPKYSHYFRIIRPYGFFILILLLMTPLLNIVFLPVEIIYKLYAQIIYFFI